MMFKNFSQISRQVSWFLFFVLLGAVIWRGSFANLDPDLGWHLKFGRDIWLTHQLPHDQLQLWSINGNWVDHEWLTNLFTFLIYRATGYIGLTFIFALVAVAGLWLIGRQLRRADRPARDVFIGLWLVLSLAAILPHLGPRPQQLSWLLLIIEFLLLKKYGDRPDWRLALGLAGFFWLWSSLHAAFFIGLVVLALWAGQALWLAWSRRRIRTAVWPLIVLGAAAIATLLTPYGLQLYDFLTTYYRHYGSLSHISEWKAIWVFPIHYWQLLFIAASAALALTLVIFKRRPRLVAWQWLAVAMFLLMGFTSVRHIPLFVASAGLVIVPAWLAANFSPDRQPAKPFPYALALQIVLPLSLFIVSWIALLTTNFFNDPFQKFCFEYPCQAGRLLQLHPRYSQLKLFNQYDYGGWLIWVWPDKQLFIDGRLPQYPFGRWSLLEEYLEFRRPDRIAAQLKTYDIEAVLWNKQLPQYHLNWLDRLLGFREADINGRTDELKQYLDNSPDWRRAFADDASVVYIRRDKF